MSSDWKARIQDQVASIPEARRTTESKRIGLHFPPDWYALVGDAARMRGMTKGAYVRRAAMAFVLFDMDLDYDTVMGVEPPMRPYPGTLDQPVAAKHGMGYGFWKIKGLGS